MGKLLPDRHPNRDFFIVDLKDARPRDEIASMEHPLYSLSVKPDMRELEYEATNGNRLRVIPSGRGLATIMDKDIVLYCISKLVYRKKMGLPISPVVEVSAHEVMVACNWMTSKASYEKFENAMIRLRGTSVVTDIKSGGEKTTHIFGLVEEAEIVRKEDGEESAFGRLSKVRIKLSAFTFRAVENREVLAIDRRYFRLRRPLERRLYELARKHVGPKCAPWKIGIEKLRGKVGTNAPLKKFRFNLREIERDGNIPDYGFSLSPDGQMVSIQRLAPAMLERAPVIPLRPDTIDKAQKKYASALGLSVSDLIAEWTEWTHEKGEELRKPDGAFIAFCQQKLASAPGVRMSEALGGAQQLGLTVEQVIPKKRPK